jgi:hypothetical protein
MSPEKDKVTRMFVLGPKAQLSQSELVGKTAHARITPNH